MIQTLAINSKEQITVKVVTDAAKKLMADKIVRQKERGIQIETLRTMIIGIPNAGKSTLMNRLAGKKIAVVGNKPGVTKGQPDGLGGRSKDERRSGYTYRKRAVEFAGACGRYEHHHRRYSGRR